MVKKNTCDYNDIIEVESSVGGFSGPSYCVQINLKDRTAHF
ncbi:hypothetical protein P0092_08165 [Ruminiclostridium papyrosolvens DSM 2782]|nr:hypothetical protein [Ruminiclostridium papyrosolvens]WES35924.1 hypothetical protein P0092_08165 [Ruminiclostridium papyrosolvens DSM 2782]